MPILTLHCEFSFAASHFLTKYHGKCEHLHGHNYRLVVSVTDELQDDGMVIDFKEVKRIVGTRVLEQLDHTHLNDIIDNPSAEHLCIWIWDRLKDALPLTKITVYETDTYAAEYTGE